jgi:pSer/pThr/pTyr-binding forkhead associated (FHA) protein
MAVLSVLELEALRNFQFNWDDLNEDHFLVAAEQHDLEVSLTQLKHIALGSPWQPPKASEEAREALLRHAGCLIPESVAQKLSAQPGALKLRTEAANLPWELAFPERLVARQGADTACLKTSPSEGPVALWAGLSHPGVFPWAQPQLEACLRGWSDGKKVVDTGQALLTEARAGVAYLVAGLSPTGELILEDLSVNLSTWVPRQAHKARKVCRCLFLHLVDHRPEQVYQRADRVARALLELGVETTIVTYWQPNLQSLPSALERFFQELGQATVGQAFEAMRNSFAANDERLSRWAFGLYGNPDLKGSDLVPLRVGSQQSATTVPRFGKADYRLKITGGPESGREVPVFSHSLAPGQRLVVGKAGLKRCQIEIKDSALAPEAFAFEWEGLEAYLVNLSKAPDGVTVEGLPVHGRLHLQGSQKIRSGASEFVFSPVGSVAGPLASSPSDSSSSAQSEMDTARYQLVVVSGVEPDQGRRHGLSGAATVVGREGTFALHDPAVSRQHMMVSQRDGLHFVSSLAELILNGVPVRAESELRHGDRLVLSATTSLLFSDSTRELAR